MRRVAGGTIALLVLALVGCGGEAPPEVDPTIYTVRGMFARVEDDGTTMTVRHEEIPGYMAAMTMPFKVSDGALLEGLEYGDKIEFTLEVYPDRLVVTAIDVLMPDTRLSWEEDTEEEPAEEAAD